MNDPLRVAPGGPLSGQFKVQGDKSISHRALIFNGFAQGSARIEGLLQAEDVAATARCMAALGAAIDGVQITGCAGCLREPPHVLDCGNSGTTMRLLLGLLSGQDLSATLTGDASLQGRPMARVTAPLSAMGARFSGADGGTRAPITVTGSTLTNGPYRSPVASAQVKTALMLAAMQGQGTLEFEEPVCSRDHTERLLTAMGVRFDRTHHEDGRHAITLTGPQVPTATDVIVPGDISSAAFFIVAASIVPGSDITITDVGLNPTRTGAIAVLRRMGAALQISNERVVSGEPIGDIRVQATSLAATEIGGAEIPRLIDELPVLAVAAALADGETRIRDAAELRVKESDRIAATVRLLQAMGVDAEEQPDGMIIRGTAGASLAPAEVAADGDHRIAMAAAVAGLCGRGETVVNGTTCIATSFPAFPRLIEQLRD
jgi:3-phosphoshikimate 1-carboxyvinyltransferase